MLKRLVPLLTVVVLVAGLLWSFMYLRALHPFGSAVTDLGDERLQNVGLVFDRATLVGWSNHSKAWQIHAKAVEVSRDRRFATFREVTDSYLMSKGERLASISASEAVYNTTTRNVALPGAVELRVKDGPVLRTKNMFWDAARSRLACSGGVTATMDGSSFQGDSMEANLENKELRVTRVRGVIRIPE